jgi:hypothetical protein
MSRHQGRGDDRFRQGPQSPPRQQPAPEVPTVQTPEVSAVVPDVAAAPAVAPAASVAPRAIQAPADVLAPSAVGPQGWKRCRALQTCLVRGVAVYPPGEFWMDPDDAERLRGKGSLEFV